MMTTRMKVCGLARVFAALAVVMMASTVVAVAADGDAWKPGKLLNEKGKRTKDASGLACATDKGFPRTCVFIDDETQAAQVVILRDGEIDTHGDYLIPLITDKYNSKALELDGEGVAFADNYFYVIGSHGLPRNKNMEAGKRAARFAAASNLIRLKFDPKSGKVTADPKGRSKALRKLIDNDPVFAPFKDRPLEEGGITVEGIAVIGPKMYVGFRGPVLSTEPSDKGAVKRAVILSAALNHFFEGGPANAELHPLNLGDDRGVRDLAPFAHGLLILSGPVTSDSGTYSIHWWNMKDGDKMELKRIRDLPNYFGMKEDKDTKEEFPDQWKPEALQVIDRGEKGVSVLVLMDAAKRGNPREFQIIYDPKHP